ncbi:MAG: AAA family ATPase, partial [Calditrichaeota bacterium]
LNALERQLLLQALEKSQNNRSRAAKALGITRQTLIAKLKKHNLHNLS